MTAIEREATIRWLTGPPDGVPRMTVGSGSLRSLPLSVDPDAFAHPLLTSPGELLAGAIGAIFAWFAAQALAASGTHARELTAEVTLTMTADTEHSAELALGGLSCTLLGWVPEIGQERLEAVARHGIDRCVESLGLSIDAPAVSVHAVLEGA